MKNLILLCFLIFTSTSYTFSQIDTFQIETYKDSFHDFEVEFSVFAGNCETDYDFCKEIVLSYWFNENLLFGARYEIESLIRNEYYNQLDSITLSDNRILFDLTVLTIENEKQLWEKRAKTLGIEIIKTGSISPEYNRFILKEPIKTPINNTIREIKSF